MTNADNDTKTVTQKQILDIEPPKDFKVIYLNDGETTFEFVEESLVNIFTYPTPEAKEKTIEINNKGSGIVAVLPFEIAEQKGVEVLLAARNQGFPLEVKLESN
jgi:ATP-dependent Clp protease adaptor protein ClpS|tara:strand:- start:446 stop:757 length:312 start_codon:yes stop_codon:yes gene_type:complete